MCSSTKPGARVEGLSLLRHRAGQVERQGASMEISVLSLAAVSTCSYTAGCTYHCLAVWKYATVVRNAKNSAVVIMILTVSVWAVQLHLVV